MEDILIIGGGPAGYTAALYCARANLKTTLIEKMAPGGQMGTTDQIDNYPGFPEGINGFDLALQMQKGAERFGTQTIFADVKELDLQGSIKKAITSNGVVEAKAVILATGADPRELGLANERSLRGKGVSYCATCDGMFYRNKTVAIVGGGDTAAADAVYLAKIAKKVYLIHRRDTLRASKSYLKPLESAENVEFVWNSEVKEILAEQKVSSIRIFNRVDETESELAVDGLFVAVGNIPNTDLFKGQIELDKSGYSTADETTKTNIDGVYAIGDLRAKPLRQIVTAASDGAVAAYCAEEYVAQLDK
ncbi:thioredoxin-disulfide reductase [Scatolibacter rhodanostii]|uniref:thioredoxin-disulfide reductase n=1 Tax=Scatolibacter rhodanostii TaxID=2014781 RepID=UPI000C06EDC4|nr:thioredoxin-disulfide reductase [Scatolibacter rhodanostii]